MGKTKDIKIEPHKKEFQLSSDEIANIQSRQELKETYSYLAKVIEKDMAMYVKQVVKPRLALKDEDILEIDTLSGKAYLEEKIPSIVVPKSGTVLPKENEQS